MPARMTTKLVKFSSSSCEKLSKWLVTNHNLLALNLVSPFQTLSNKMVTKFIEFASGTANVSGVNLNDKV